jgi:hypothetical protein
VAEKRYTYRIFVGNFERKMPIGTPGRRWGNNIKMKLKYDGMASNSFSWFRIRTNGGLFWTR